MDKYKNKYRISSTRLQYWDYGSNAFYYVTICTKNRDCFFGNVVGGEMVLSAIGIMADKYWLEIPQHFPFVILHNHIIMPNHVHGIIEIAKSNDIVDLNDGHIVETQNFASLHQPANMNEPKNRFGPQSQNLAAIIRGFKIGVTKNARLINPDFQWQPRFYDHIIRDENTFSRISDYITDNPINWKEDKFFQSE